MKAKILMLSCALLTAGCNAQENNQSGKTNNTPATGKNQPKISWKVDKQTDDNGNIIRYDSTYTWSYSNAEGENVSVDVDSVMKSFHSFFNQQYPSVWQHNFGGPVWNDSLLYRDFFQPDYFAKRWRNDFFEMDNMFRQMDSLRNKFFHDSFPGLSPLPETKPKEKTKSTTL